MAVFGLVFLLLAGAVGAVGYKVMKQSKNQITLPGFAFPKDEPQPTPTIRPHKRVRTVVPDLFRDRYVRTAYDDSFVRVKRTAGVCKTQGGKAFVKMLAAHPCVGKYRAAAYVAKKRTAIVTVVVMPFRTAAEAAAVKKLGLYPYLLDPGPAPGVPSIKGRTVNTWGGIYVNGNLAVFAMAHRLDGGKRDPSGLVQSAAVHLGEEFFGLLNW
ncbi:hypothetical protein GCM10027589_30440 [Actinocorallia lasiicapitis]